MKAKAFSFVRKNEIPLVAAVLLIIMFSSIYMVTV